MDAVSLIKKHLESSPNGTILLNKLYLDAIDYEIKDNEIVDALTKLEEEKYLKVEKIRPLLWEWRITKL